MILDERTPQYLRRDVLDAHWYKGGYEVSSSDEDEFNESDHDYDDWDEWDDEWLDDDDWDDDFEDDDFDDDEDNF